ncbi:MAG: T9SS type A sorting domain-containing protein [Bacteroidales bacterium]|nr:T9SS type A sorting domain-containing protein [Bacteroidales bacterium]
MKKLLLIVAVALLSVTAINAQVLGTKEWNKTLTTVAAAEDATNGVMAIDDNGNLFVSGALTTTATFGSTSLEPIGLAQYIVKYNATGAEQWATAIQGPATITAMDTDAEGNLYVAGKFADEILVCDVTENQISLVSSNSDSQTAAFIAKYSATGTLIAAQACEATVDATVNDSYMYFGYPAEISINNIQVEGDALYVSFTYNGDVTLGGFSLDAKYLFNSMGFGDYLDTTSGAVIALNNTTLAPSALIVNASVKEDNASVSRGINDINFTVEDGNAYVSVVGFGDLTIQTANSSQDVTFAMDGMGTNEYGMIIAKVGAIEAVKVYNNVSTSLSVTSYNKVENMEVIGDNLYITGTFRGYCPLDNTLSTLDGDAEKSTSDIYVASLATSTLSTNWVVTTPDKNDEVNQQYESIVGAMIYPNEVRMVTAVKKVSGNAVVSTSNQLVSFAGEVSSLDTEQATAVAYNGTNAAYILNNSTSSALYYGTIPVQELVNEETVEVINGEILKTNVWNSSISAVGATDANPASPAAMDADGNLYVSGTQTQDFDFAGTTIGSLGIGAYVAKYDVAGNEKFAFALYGSIALTAMTTDAEGNLYVAGSFTDEAYITDIEGQTGDYETITGATGDWSMERPSSFLAKYDANGNLLSVNTFDAVAGYDTSAEYWGGVPYVSINKIVSEGEKVYVQFTYNGDVTIDTVTLEAKYMFYFWSAYMDIPSNAVVSFDTDMIAIAKEAELSMAVDGADSASSVESFNFAVKDGEVYVSAFGYGNLALTTPVGSETFSFAIDSEGNTEHGAVVAKVGATLETKKFSNITTGTYNVFNVISGMDVYAGNIYIAGTFNETFAFANTTTAAGASDIFAVCLNASDLSATWTATDAKDEGATNTYYEVATGMILYKGNVYVTGAVIDMNEDEVTENLNYNVSSEGNMSLGVARPAMATAYCDDYAALVNFTETTNVAYYSFEELVGIEESVVDGTSNITYANGMYIFTEAVDAQIYDVQGRCVKAVKAATEIATEGLNKGVYILKAGSEVVKFVK